MPLELILILLLLLLVLIIILFVRAQIRVRKLEKKYAQITNIETEVENFNQERQRFEQGIITLREEYEVKRAYLDQMAIEAAIYNEEIELAGLGFYRPHFDFGTSERYKEEITQVKQEQRNMISSKEAIVSTQKWQVAGSKAEGKKMIDRGIKLTARAFNNECDAAISSIRWNNAERMEKRVEKAYTAINTLNQSNTITISNTYYQLKLKELRLVHEYAEKKQQEKAEQQEIKRKMREEASLAKEIEKAFNEEMKYQALLEKMRLETEKATGAKLDSLNTKIALLNQELQVAHENSVRAKSMAQQTKRGYVYVISNIGSFGKDVYKLGMTRRLEPLDRVKELGDASVPFVFDVHAMIHTDDAPALESALHKKFDHMRLNLVNNRKEFFRVSLEEIESEVRRYAPEAEFIKTAEARDYHESQSILAQNGFNRQMAQ